MSEALTDYDLDTSIRCIAAQLGISGCSTDNIKDVFDKIESICPAASEILLERTFEKDKLRDYVTSNPSIKIEGNSIIGDGDPIFEKHWNNLVNLYPMLLDAINECNNKNI